MKLSKHINSTLLCLIGSVLVAALFVAHAVVPAVRNVLPEDACLASVSDGALLCEGVGDETPVSRGEDFRILGVCGPKSSHPGFFWVENAQGLRGYAAQSIFGARAVMTKGSRHLHYDKGDSVTILSATVSGSWVRYAVETDRGDVFNVNATDVATVEALAFMKRHHALADTPRRLMNTRQFERLYLLRTQKQNNGRHIPPAVIAREGEGTATLENICLLAEDGKWYRVEMHYDADGIARRYSVREGFSRNPALCRALYAPLQNVLAFAPTAMQGGTPLYRPVHESVKGGFAGVMKTVGKVLWWILYTLPWLYLTPLFLSLLLYGLVGFPKLFRHLGNRALRVLTALLALLGVLLWFVVLLPVLPAWLYLGEVAVLWLFFRLLGRGVLSSKIPHRRCPECRSIGTLQPSERKLAKEYDSWEASTARLNREIKGFKQYSTSNKHSKAVIYEDGQREVNTWETDKKQHVEEQGVDTYADYKVRYRVREYENWYCCSACGHQEMRTSKEKTEEERRQQGTYTKSYDTHTVENQ